MVSPPLEGLAALLDKNPIVPTFKARDLQLLPADIEAAYERHVRGYMPLSRGAGDEAADMAAYEQKLVRLIRDAKAPIGYVSAEYGHGKTSTGLFLWDSARRANVLAVPPFSLDRLEDLFTAVAGWTRFMVERVRPGLGAEVDAVYQQYRAEGIEALAQQHAERFQRPYAAVLTEFRELDQQGKLQTSADGLTYVNFLEAMTALALKAGYDGLLVVADEVQQYIEHADVSSAVEPIGRLFDLITTMLSRTGRLACGLILLLPNKELGLLNQQRGDLVQRIKANRLALDLTQMYGPDFAAELWQRLAQTFRFTDVADTVIDADALQALGEIAARTDLASGPRTVVDVLKLACERHRAGADTPFGVLDLVGAFEQGQVAFDGLSRIQQAVRQAVSHELVRGRPDAERAVRLMAAFPSSGLNAAIQQREGVREAVDDLVRLAGGELVAIRGGGYDHTGRAVEAGVTLLALRPAQEQVTWLKGTIRDFRRGYFLGSDQVQRFAVRGIAALLAIRLFPAPHWRVEREFESTALSQNQGLLLRGAFPGASRRFPERAIYCRIMRPGETAREVQTAHDLLIDLVLHVPVEQEAESQRSSPGSLGWVALNHARVELNLLRRDQQATYLELNPGFEDIVAPYDVNPLLTLSLHAHLAALLASGSVPGGEESNVRDLFLPALLGAALRDLFTAELGRSATPPLAAADLRFFEAVIELLCERTYGDAYVTLMVTGAWRKALDEYRGALQKLDNPFILNGSEPFQGAKRELAELLTRTNPALDNFIQSFPQLISVETPFRGDAPGKVRFTLHPLEQRMVQFIQTGERVPRLNPRTGQATEAPTVQLAALQQTLSAAGYRLTEVEAGLALLEARRMVDLDERTGTVALSQPDIPPLDVVKTALNALTRRVTALRPFLSEAALRILDTETGRVQRALSNPDRPPRGAELLAAQRVLDQSARTLEQDVVQRRRELVTQASELAASEQSGIDLGQPLLQAVASGLFGDQLNAVRMALQHEVQALQTQSAGVRAAVDEALGTLNKPLATDTALVQAAAQLKQAAAAAATVRLRRDQLQRTIADYRAATQLLAQAQELLSDKLAPLGETAATQRDALQRWSADVTGQLAAHRAQALAQTSAWQAALADIRREIGAFEHDRRETFTARQTALRAILTNEFHVGSNLLPPPLVFNPADPDESYRLLTAQVTAALHDASARLTSQLEGIASVARAQQQPEQLAQLPAEQRAHAAAEMATVEQQTRALALGVTALFAELLDGIVGGEPGALQIQARAVVAQAVQAGPLFQRVQTLTKQLQAVALTDAEARANAVLVSLSAGDRIDFAELERRLRAELPGADPWTLLRALVQKSRARVQIEVIRG
ncbi:MAG: hypothetical protein ACYDCQ_01205 [Dehalococcoidia bacterium]